jgi:hypothetical protein
MEEEDREKRFGIRAIEKGLIIKDQLILNSCAKIRKLF